MSREISHLQYNVDPLSRLPVTWGNILFDTYWTDIYVPRIRQYRYMLAHHCYRNMCHRLNMALNSYILKHRNRTEEVLNTWPVVVDWFVSTFGFVLWNFRTSNLICLHNCHEIFSVLLQLIGCIVSNTSRGVFYYHWLTHWGWVTHTCIRKLTTISSDNGLSRGRRQVIIRTNYGILSIRPLETNFSKILILIKIVPSKWFIHSQTSTSHSHPEWSIHWQCTWTYHQHGCNRG